MAKAPVVFRVVVRDEASLLARCRCEPRHTLAQVWRCPAYIRQDNP